MFAYDLKRHRRQADAAALYIQVKEAIYHAILGLISGNVIQSEGSHRTTGAPTSETGLQSPEQERRHFPYRYGGEEPALLLVHGMTFDHTSVRQSQVGAFSADFRVVCVDLHSHGGCPAAANSATSASRTTPPISRTLIDTLGLKDVTLVGWSMGGAIAQLFAATYSGKISRLVLVGSTPQLLADDKFKDALPPRQRGAGYANGAGLRERLRLRHDRASRTSSCHSDTDGDRHEKPAQDAVLNTMQSSGARSLLGYLP